LVNLSEKLRLSSLLTRYVVAASALVLVLFVATSYTSHLVNLARKDTSQHILQREDFLQQVRQLRTAIRSIEISQQRFLLNPRRNLSQLRASIDTALMQTQKLQRQPWVSSLHQQDSLAKFSDTLQLLDITMANLIETRLDARKQYPALIYANDSMLPYNKELLTVTNLAIDEFHEHEIFADANYLKFLRIRQMWTQMISNFRMYLANRLGSFDEKQLSVQQHNIVVTLNDIQGLVAALRQQDRAGKLKLQASISIEETDRLLKMWRVDFNKVVKIQNSDKWRADAYLLRTRIHPLFQQLWQSLQTFDSAIDSTTITDMATLAKTNNIQTKLLWGMFAAGIAFILLIYVVLDKLLLLPIRKVVFALRAESHGDQETLLPTPNSQETLQLINAFKEMRQQIHNRQDDLEYQALHDSLTGLANRHLLFDRLKQAIQHARRQQQSLAFYILDLDRFKEINDTMGHQVGDRLLEEVGLRLTETLRDTDTVARLGGDEFAILIEDCKQAKAIHVANKILNAFEQTYHINNLHLYLGVSIGIAFYPEHDHSAQGLIKRADIAMYVAKRSKNGYAIYDIEQDQHSINRLALDSDLRGALEESDQLTLFYQPKLDMQNHLTSEVEALLRWQHPEHGAVPPAEIIPLAEQTGLIQSLTYWVVEAAIQQHLAWRLDGLTIKIAVNISTYNLQDKKFFPSIKSLLLRYQVGGDFLIFELTETAMMSDPAHAIASISAFCELGIQFSIDDFGTGFSSLSYLKQLPAHELKIDKSFVMNMHKNDNDAVIVRSIIELAHNLSLRVIAEGVEDKDTLDLLSIINCDAVQGFYIQRPASASDITTWFRNHFNTIEKQSLCLP